MSYPNQEQKVDKQSEMLECLHQRSQKKEQDSLQKRNEEPSVGELKWSKEEEKGVKENADIDVTQVSGQKGFRDKKIAIRVLQILGLPFVLGIVLITGLIIGHSVLGGQPAGDVFDITMWERLYRLIFR
jgi:hypothetical protein